jgi:hypothetical protein
MRGRRPSALPAGRGNQWARAYQGSQDGQATYLGVPVSAPSPGNGVLGARVLTSPRAGAASPRRRTFVGHVHQRPTVHEQTGSHEALGRIVPVPVHVIIENPSRRDGTGPRSNSWAEPRRLESGYGVWTGLSLCALDGLSVDSVTSMAHVNGDAPGRRARSDAGGGAAGPDRVRRPGATREMTPTVMSPEAAGKPGQVPKPGVSRVVAPAPAKLPKPADVG